MKRLSFEMALHLYRIHLKSKGFSKKTLKRYLWELDEFFMWVREKKKKYDLRNIDSSDIESYQKHIHFQMRLPDKKKKRYCESTQEGIMRTLKICFKYFAVSEYILFNPVDSVELKFVKKYPLRNTLSIDEMNKLLDSIEPVDLISLRDRALFELMYGTGLRVSEVSYLDITDVNMHEGKLFVRKGKGRKERIIPIGKYVVRWLKLYVQGSRENLRRRVKDAKENQGLFLTRRGRRITIGAIETKLKKWLKDAGLRTEGVSPHIIRHSFATHMLENEANIKHVKDILGHSSLQTTVIYTHLTIRNIRKLMKMYHPREGELYAEIKEEDYIRCLKD